MQTINSDLVLDFPERVLAAVGLSALPESAKAVETERIQLVLTQRIISVLLEYIEPTEFQKLSEEYEDTEDFALFLHGLATAVPHAAEIIHDEIELLLEELTH